MVGTYDDENLYTMVGTGSDKNLNTIVGTEKDKKPQHNGGHLQQ